MSWIDLVFAGGVFVFVVCFVGRQVVRDRRNRRFHEEIEAEWAEVRRLGKDPDPAKVEEGARRALVLMQRRSPPV